MLLADARPCPLIYTGNVHTASPGTAIASHLLLLSMGLTPSARCSSSRVSPDSFCCRLPTSCLYYSTGAAQQTCMPALSTNPDGGSCPSSCLCCKTDRTSDNPWMPAVDTQRTCAWRQPFGKHHGEPAHGTLPKLFRCLGVVQVLHSLGGKCAIK
jgi:hypothetical protein